MESSKKKSSSSKRSQSPVDVAEKDKVQDEEIVQTTPAPKKKSSKSSGGSSSSSSSSSSKKSSKSSKEGNKESNKETAAVLSTNSSSPSQDQAEMEDVQVSSQQQTTTTTTTTTTTSSASINGSTSASTSIPTTPISKFIPSLSNMGTPLSPNRTALRLKEKDELANIKSKLQSCLKKLESTENELEKKSKELEDLEQQNIVTINALKNRSEQLDKQLVEEIKAKSELISTRDALESELRTKEATWKKDQDEYLIKLSETINKLNQEHSIVVSQLKSDITAKEYEMETSKNEISRLKEDLQYRMRESEDKSRKLLDNEYNRMKQKEEEFNIILGGKDDEIKKLKIELKEKEKLTQANSKKESELSRRVEAHERQIEDMRDSINREWEIKAAQMLEEHHARNVGLEQIVERYEEDKQRFNSQIEVLNSQIEELNIKNNELEDKVKELNEVIIQKDNSIGTLNNELEETKKVQRKLGADLKKKDSQISLLQVEINNRENKCNTYQTEINRLKTEIYSINSQTEPDIPLTKEIEDIKTLVKDIEMNVNERKRKRHRTDQQVETQDINGESQSSNAAMSTDSSSSSSSSAASAAAAQIDPETLEKFNSNTVSFSTIDTTQELIKLSVHGDHDNGLSLSKWRLIIVKPDGSKNGFSFPEGIQPFRGIKSVTVWTGRQRPADAPTTENEFFWARQGLWTQPVEGTIVKLVSPNEVTTTATIPSSGIYERAVEQKSTCLIM